MDVTSHNVSTIRLDVASSGDTKWVEVSSYDEKGKINDTVTYYAVTGKNIVIELGGE